MLLLALATVVRADSPPPALRSAITGGGGALAANGYQLTGAIGQPLAGPVATQGQYGLTSGLFGGAGGSHVYVGIVRR
jgi:hypothetical protein